MLQTPFFDLFYSIIFLGVCRLYFYCTTPNSYYYYQNERTDYNHAVSVVGWDDNFSKSNFKSATGAQPPSNGAWLIKNNWGNHSTTDNGFFWLSYYDSSSSYVVAYDAEPVSNYDHIYGYNGYCPYLRSYLNDNKIEYANVFTSSGDETLEAVGLWALQDDINYTVKVYRKLPSSSAKPTDGTLVNQCTTTGNMLRQGYYTVKLNDKVKLLKNEKYSVVVSASAASLPFILYPFEGSNVQRESFSIGFSSNEGESFICRNSTWYDVKNYTATELNNALINVYTKDTISEKSDFLYTVNEKGGATITGYSGSETSIIIPETIDGYSVTEIGKNAFTYCDSLESISFPSSLETIADGAFSSCTALKTLNVPRNVISIGQQAFDKCTALQSVKLNEGNNKLSVGNYAFLNCTELKTIDIEFSNIEIGYKALGFSYNYDTGSFSPTGLTIRGYNDSPAYEYYQANSTNIKWISLNKVLESIEITENPARTSYKINESFDSSGIVVTASYSDGSKKTVTDCTYSGFSSAKSGPVTVTALYTEGGITKSANFVIVVEEPITHTYAVKYNANGGTGAPAEQIKTHNVVLKLSTTKPSLSGYTFKEWNTKPDGMGKSYAPGANYTENVAVTLYAIWKKNPVTLSSISVKTKPTKLSYYVGDTLDTTGMVIKATYSDGTTKDIETGWTCSPTVFSNSGSKTIAVTYEGRTTAFTVTVNEKPATPTYTLSVSESNVSVKANGTKTITCSYSFTGVACRSITIRYIVGDLAVTSCSFGNWDGLSIPMTVEGIKPGSTTIKLELLNADTNDVLATKVVSVAVTQTQTLSLKVPESIELKYNSTKKLDTSVIVDNGVSYTLKYELSNPGIITIDKNGNMTAIKRGTTTVKAILTDQYGNTVTDTCNVTVSFSFGQWLIWILLLGFLWY